MAASLKRGLFDEVIALVIVGIIVLTLGMVVVQRSGKAKGEVAASIVKSASAYAKAITAEAQAGVVEPAKPLPTLPLVVETAVVPAMEKKVEDSPEKTMPAMSEKTPEKTRVPEEIKRMRDKRFKQVEAAIDSPIKVQVEEAKSLRSGTAEISSLEQQIATLGQTLPMPTAWPRWGQQAANQARRTIARGGISPG